MKGKKWDAVDWRIAPYFQSAYGAINSSQELTLIKIWSLAIIPSKLMSQKMQIKAPLSLPLKLMQMKQLIPTSFYLFSNYIGFSSKSDIDIFRLKLETLSE